MMPCLGEKENTHYSRCKDAWKPTRGHKCAIAASLSGDRESTNYPEQSIIYTGVVMSWDGINPV